MSQEGNKDIWQDFDKSKFEEAIRLRDNGKFQEAIDILKELLSKYPQKPALLAIVARLHWKIGNLEKATDLFGTAIDIKPKSETISLGLFHCLWELGKQVEALDEAKRFMSVSYSKDYINIIHEISKEVD